MKSGSRRFNGAAFLIGTHFDRIIYSIVSMRETGIGTGAPSNGRNSTTSGLFVETSRPLFCWTDSPCEVNGF
jgi:hypothetical protein